jgi:hypothetical protein
MVMDVSDLKNFGFTTVSLFSQIMGPDFKGLMNNVSSKIARRGGFVHGSNGEAREGRANLFIYYSQPLCGNEPNSALVTRMNRHLIEDIGDLLKDSNFDNDLPSSSFSVYTGITAQEKKSYLQFEFVILLDPNENGFHEVMNTMHQFGFNIISVNTEQDTFSGLTRAFLRTRCNISDDFIIKKGGEIAHYLAHQWGVTIENNLLKNDSILHIERSIIDIYLAGVSLSILNAVDSSMLNRLQGQNNESVLEINLTKHGSLSIEESLEDVEDFDGFGP